VLQYNLPKLKTEMRTISAKMGKKDFMASVAFLTSLGFNYLGVSAAFRKKETKTPKTAAP
jgi:hypothetical protein